MSSDGTCCPSRKKYTAPRVGFCSPSMVRNSEVFPPPFGPETRRKSPWKMSRLIPSSTLLSANESHRSSIAIVLFLLVQSFFGRFFDPIEIILSCVGWISVGNSNWYLFDILLLYMITYVSFTISKDRKMSLSLVLIFSLISMVLLAQYQNGTRWYNTFLCFWLGMVYAQIKPKYEKMVQKDKKKYYWALAVLVIIFLISILLRNVMLFYIIHALVFTLLINHLSMIVHIDNPVLKWLGSHIFSIYILQRIPMIIGDHLEFIDEHMIVYFIFSLVMTGIMAEVFDRFVHMISKKVFGPIKMMVKEG